MALNVCDDIVADDREDISHLFDSMYRQARDDVRYIDPSRRDPLQDRLVSVRGCYCPVMLPVDTSSGDWGEVEQNFMYQYLSPHRYGCYEGLLDHCYMLGESGMADFSDQFHDKMRAGVHEGSFGLSGDTLSVTPAVYRGIKPALEDILLGLMVSHDEADPCHFKMTYKFWRKKLLPHLVGKQYSTPFEFAYDCIRFIKGYVQMMTNHGDEVLLPFNWVEDVVKDMAKYVGNPAPRGLRSVRKYDLSDPQRKRLYDKIVGVFGTDGRNAEVVIFLMNNMRFLGDFSVLDDPEVVDLVGRMPLWVQSGFVVGRVSSLYKVCRKAHADSDPSVPLKASLRVCRNIYEGADRPWWFKEDEDLTRFFDIDREDVAVNGDGLKIGVCPEGFALVERISAVAGPYFVHACELYKAAGYRVVDAGLSPDRAISITSDIARWYGVHNVRRGVRVVEHLLTALSQGASGADTLSLFREHLECHRPESPFIGKLEGDVSLRMPGLNLLLNIASGGPVEEDDGVDEFNMSPAHLAVIEDFLAKPLDQRVGMRNPLLTRLDADRQHLMLVGSTPLLLEDHAGSGSNNADGVLVRHMRFNRMLREVGCDSEVVCVYFNVFAQKMPDPLDPPKKLLQALAQLSRINVPVGMVLRRDFPGVRFVADDDSVVAGMDNKTLRYLGLVTLLDARNIGLVTDKQIDKVLDILSVERPGHDDDWAVFHRLKADEELQRSCLGLPPRDYELTSGVWEAGYQAAKSWAHVCEAEQRLLGLSDRERDLFGEPVDQLEEWLRGDDLASSFRSSIERVLRMRERGYEGEDFDNRFSRGTLEVVRDKRHACMDRREKLDRDWTRSSRFQAQAVLQAREAHQERVNEVCRLRAQGLKDEVIPSDGCVSLSEEGFSWNGEDAGRWYVENVYGKGRVRTAHQIASQRDNAHLHRLYDVTGSLSDVCIALADAMNLVKMGILTVNDVRAFAWGQIESLKQVGAVRYQPVSDAECQKRNEVGDKARKYDFRKPIDPKKVNEMVARGVFNIQVFRDVVRTVGDIDTVTRILGSIVEAESLYADALRAAEKAVSNVLSFMSLGGVSRGNLRDTLLKYLSEAREVFMNEVRKCEEKISTCSPEVVRFLNFAILGDQLAKLEDAVINWFAKVVPAGMSPDRVATAVTILYAASSTGGNDGHCVTTALDAQRGGTRFERDGRRLEEMRRFSNDMLELASRMLVHIWISSGADPLVDRVRDVLSLPRNDPHSTALAVRDRVSFLDIDMGSAFEKLLPRARQVIINARRESAYLVSVGAKVHTVIPIDERYLKLIKAVLGLDSSSFKLTHSDKTLVLPPASSPLELALLLNGLVLFGVIPLNVSDVRRNGGRDDVLPDAQICLPVGKLSAENCAFLGSSVLLATDDGVRRYSPDAFVTTDGATGARMMIYDGGARNLNFPFMRGMDFGRVDMLGRRSVVDIKNLQLLGPVLSHSQFGGPFADLSGPFKEQYRKILSGYGDGRLEDVLQGSLVHDRRPSYTRDEQLASLACVNACCGAWHAHATAINEAVTQGREPPGGIIFQVRGLFDDLRAEVSKRVRVLYDRGEFRDELDISLAGQDLYLSDA